MGRVAGQVGSSRRLVTGRPIVADANVIPAVTDCLGDVMVMSSRAGLHVPVRRPAHVAHTLAVPALQARGAHAQRPLATRVGAFGVSRRRLTHRRTRLDKLFHPVYLKINFYQKIISKNG